MANYMQQGLSDEISINIFKYVTFPLSLILTCKNWYNISNDHMARAEWIVNQYGRAHALFHSIRLGPKFINLAVTKAIITNGAIIYGYFIQRLLLHFGKMDQLLNKLKTEHNATNNQNGRITQQ
ncbi:9649_t:CDS:1, partial [Scutellospora calospora]